MKFKLKSLVIGSLLSFIAPTVLMAADANDNYTTATVEKWVNDESNNAVGLLDIMSCFAGQGGVSRAGFANKSWIALVDEVKCGMDNGDTSGQDKKATIQFTSSLASVGGTQEVLGYMVQSDGQKVVMNMQIKKSASALPPYGDWYSSFYFVNDADKNFTNQTGTVIHGYGEVKQVGSDVVVMSAHTPLGPDTPSIETRIVYAGGSVADVTYNYKLSGLSGGAAFMNGFYLGKANATELYTGFVNTSDVFQDNRAQCKKRDSIWQSTWLGALYDTTTNARLKLATPPFRFTVDSDKSRGEARKDGAWMENNTLRMKLDPVTNTVAVTRSDTDAAVTLQWTPTRMATKSYTTFEPATNDMFNSGEGTDGRAKWDGTDLKVDRDGNSANGYEASVDRVTRVWSSFYDSEFAYVGSTTPGTWKMINMIPFASGSYPSSGASAKYKCFATYNCPHTNNGNGNINPTLAEYKAIVADTSTDWWQEFHGGKDRTHSNTTEFHYYLTAITPPTGYLGATLYWDDEKDGLDTDDKPVMFKFNVANEVEASDGQWAQKVVEHGEDTVRYFTTDSNALNDARSNELQSDEMWATLIPETSSCNASNWHNCSDAVEFNARQWVYDHPLIAKDASGAVIDLSPTMKMKYTQAIADDLNYNGGTPISIPATFSSGDWIEWLSERCVPGMTGDLDADGDNSTCQIEIDLTKFSGKVLNIRYDGEMNNLPGYYDRAQDTFYRLINPKDGAIFTNMADDKTYKYKALGIDEVFVTQTNAASCGAGVKFTSTPTGFAAADLPSYSDTTKTRPSQIWNTKPTAPSCILEGDVETNCD